MDHPVRRNARPAALSPGQNPRRLALTLGEPTLLVVALIAVVGLVVAVAIVASDGDSSDSPLWHPPEGKPFVIPHK